MCLIKHPHSGPIFSRISRTSIVEIRENIGLRKLAMICETSLYRVWTVKLKTINIIISLRFPTLPNQMTVNFFRLCGTLKFTSNCCFFSLPPGCETWHQVWLSMTRKYGRYSNCYATIKRAWCVIEEYLLAHNIDLNVELDGEW